MAKIERKYLAHFIEAGDQFLRLGRDLEEYSAELSATVEKTKNILGEVSVAITGYEKSASVEPYYAEPGDKLFELLQEILDGDLVLDSLKTRIAEVKLWEEPQGTAYPCVVEEAYIEIVSYGGDTTGYQIPFKLHYTGNRIHGTFNVTSKAFTQNA